MIRGPADLKKLSLEGLEHLAEDLRQRIIATCLKNGGHLGASLGAVELALALHYVFDSPREPILWDVGHQAYAHKLLTGRWKEFETLRLTGGISGFLSREESAHDVFGAGHSSTSLSAALGIAAAKRILSAGASTAEKDWTVAVIGDGGLTAGLALEALNNLAATERAPLLIVLNDNQMSISANVGALPQLLAQGKAQEFFELMGCAYAGPINGHDLGALIGSLQGLKEAALDQPIVLHAITQKGKGYAPAEDSPASYHGVSPMRAQSSGKIPAQAGLAAPTDSALSLPVSNKEKSYSDAFGEALCELAEKDERIVAITAAMPDGTGLTEFARRFPARFFDVGIAESHAVAFAAGLATQGMRPVVAVYSTFLQRALDEIIHDVALQKLGVTFAIDRAGIVGADGPTHHGAFDLVYLSMTPGLELLAPAIPADIAPLLEHAVNVGRPVAIRYPRGTGADTLEPPLNDGMRVHALPENAPLLVVALGPAIRRAQAALARLGKEGERCGLISVVRAKPLPEPLLAHLRASPQAALFLVEDGVARGGFSESVLAALGPRPGTVEICAYADHFIAHGAPADLEEREGISAAAIARKLRARLS